MNKNWHTKSMNVPALEEAFDQFGMRPNEATCEDLYQMLVTIGRTLLMGLIPGAVVLEENFIAYNTLDQSAWPKCLGRGVELHADYHTPFIRLLCEYVHENPRETYWQARLEIATQGQSLSLIGSQSMNAPQFSVTFEEDSEYLFTLMVDTLARVFDYTPYITSSKVHIYHQNAV